MAAHRSEPAPRSPDANPACYHHWLIDAQVAPASATTCKRCGAKREFANAGCDYAGERYNATSGKLWAAWPPAPESPARRA